VRWEDALALALGAVALAPLGTRTALAMKPRLLRRCFAVGASRGWVAARRGPLKTAAGRELGSGSDLGTH